MCHAWPYPDVVCPDCWQRFTTQPVRCTGCALALPGLSPDRPRCGACLRHPPLWQHAHAWVDYQYPWNHLVTRWKFGQQPALAQHFARWLHQEEQLHTALEAADVVIPIPLSRERMRERGYNPAAQLAQQLAPHKCQLQTLQRQRHSAPQSDLPRVQRLRNLHHAFVISETQHHLVADQKVLLIDDVLTTGATFTVACQCLLKAGAAHVEVLSLARTP